MPVAPAGTGRKAGGRKGDVWSPAGGNPSPESTRSGMVQLTLPPDTPWSGA
jgi:hypothetical protein